MEQSLEQKIESAYEELTRAKLAKKHVDYLQRKVADLVDTEHILKLNMKQEHQDVLLLEKRSLKNLFGDILGNLDQQLEIERQEYLQAVLRYRSVADELEICQFELKILQKRVKEIPSLERKLSSLLQIKEQKIRFKDPVSAAKISDFNMIIDLRKSRLIEIKEALKIGAQLLKEVDHILGDLNKVKNFGHTPLMQGKGRYSSYNKKTYIDHSQKKALLINSLLLRFEHELQDIYKDYKSAFEIEEFESFIDNFYDHLITDWIIQQQLNSAIAGTMSIYTKLKRLNSMVEAEAKAEMLLIAQGQEAKKSYLLAKSNSDKI